MKGVQVKYKYTFAEEARDMRSEVVEVPAWAQRRKMNWKQLEKPAL